MFGIEDIEEMRYQLLKIMQEEPGSYRQYAIMMGFPAHGNVLKSFLSNARPPRIATLLKIKKFIEDNKSKTYA